MSSPSPNGAADPENRVQFPVRMYRSVRELSRNRTVRRLLQLLVLAACAWYLAKGVPDLGVFARMRGKDFAFIALSWVANLGSVFLGTVSWWLILRACGAEMRWSAAAAVHLSSNLAKYIPGYAWQVMSKAVQTRESNVAPRTVAFAMVLELACLIWVGVALSLIFAPASIALPYLPAGVLKWSGILGSALLMSGVAWPLVVRKTATIVGQCSGGWSERRSIAIWVAYMVVVIGWCAFGSSLWILSQAIFPIELSRLPLFLFCVAGSVTIGLLVVFAPAGIGVRESAIVFVMNSVMPMQSAVLLAALFRVVVALGEVGAFFSFRILTAYVNKARNRANTP
jgi:glycosyltransferase 2 family protein